MSEAPLSKSAFARRMGVDKAQPSRWAQRGMPTLPDGKVDPVVATAWVHANIDPTQRESRGGTNDKPDRPPRAAPLETAARLLTERVRLTQAQADEQEMENDLRRGQIVEVADVAKLVGQDYARVRNRLLAIPAEHAPQLARLKTPAEVQAALGGLVEAVLSELSDDHEPAPAPRMGTFAEERTRVAHARANGLELANRERQGQLVSLELAETVLFETTRAARDAWMNWPVVTGPLMATDLGVDPEKVTRLLVEHVHRQLVALGEPDADFGGKANA